MTNIIQNSKALNLLQVCQQYYNNPLMQPSDCVKACSVCSSNNFVSEGSPCKPGDSNACKSPYGDLTCTACSGIGCPTEGGKCAGSSTSSISNGALCPATLTGFDRTSCSSCQSACHVTDANNKKCGC